MKNSKNSSRKKQNNHLEINVNYKEMPITTLILLCLSKPDVTFILFCYLSIYVIIFYLILTKLYIGCLEYYNLVISRISPETISNIDYYYNYISSIINYGISFTQYYLNKTEIKQIQYQQN